MEYRVHIDETHLLIDFTHWAGTNELTVKKGFKELFGTTVFTFWNTTKMEQAKEVLLGKEMAVYEVSNAIGYKDPRHFSTMLKENLVCHPTN